MAEPQERLTLTAQALLDACVLILDTTAARAPVSQFLTSWRPAFDCEFVAVQIPRIGEDNTSPLQVLETKKRNRFGNLIVATFVIYVVRCGPVLNGGIPTDAAKTTNAGIVLQDGWVLWNGMRDQQDEIFDDCLGVYFDGGVPLPESGNYVGWQFQIRANIEGYTP
jgi:hypothetical protein